MFPISPLAGVLVTLSLLAPVSCDVKQRAEYQTLPSLREQANLQDSWTKKRLDLIPGLLDKYGVDAWLMSQREYAEDTVFWSLKRATQFSARRRTTLLFVRQRDSHPQSPASYVWIDNTPALFTELREVLERHGPRKIAINAAEEISFSSGMHAGELELFHRQLGADDNSNSTASLTDWAERFVTVPMLAVEFVATMVEERRAWYAKMMETAWALVEEGFSERVINPGVTTTEDVEWWMREKTQQLGYGTWFHPSVSVMDESFPLQRLQDDEKWMAEPLEPQADGYAGGRVIQHGDYLHVDFGVSALGLNTDTQHLGYVLRPGETEKHVPEGLLQGLKKANRMQDIVRENMKIGLTGNAILKASLEQMREEGIEGKVYCHPIGDWGHSAGTLIGMTNLQDGVPNLGELPLLKNTYYSVELLARHFVPKKNATLAFPLEEDVYWKEGTQSWEWVRDRQANFHLIRQPMQDMQDSTVPDMDEL